MSGIAPFSCLFDTAWPGIGVRKPGIALRSLRRAPHAARPIPPSTIPLLLTVHALDLYSRAFPTSVVHQPSPLHSLIPTPELVERVAAAIAVILLPLGGLAN